MWDALVAPEEPAPPAKRSSSVLALLAARAKVPPMLKAGDKVGMLTLIEFFPGKKKPVRVKAKWSARCDCGNTKTFFNDNLKGGFSSSCGCMRGKRQL